MKSSSSSSQVAVCISQLDRSIAWEKSPMKVVSIHNHASESITGIFEHLFNSEFLNSILHKLNVDQNDITLCC